MIESYLKPSIIQKSNKNINENESLKKIHKLLLKAEKDQKENKPSTNAAPTP